VHKIVHIVELKAKRRRTKFVSFWITMIFTKILVGRTNRSFFNINKAVYLEIGYSKVVNISKFIKCHNRVPVHVTCGKREIGRADKKSDGRERESGKVENPNGVLVHHEEAIVGKKLDSFYLDIINK
jgi:hypothetical protein